VSHHSFRKNFFEKQNVVRESLLRLSVCAFFVTSDSLCVYLFHGKILRLSPVVSSTMGAGPFDFDALLARLYS